MVALVALVVALRQEPELTAAPEVATPATSQTAANGGVNPGDVTARFYYREQIAATPQRHCSTGTPRSRSWHILHRPDENAPTYQAGQSIPLAHPRPVIAWFSGGPA
jgi:hypothetical protein